MFCSQALCFVPHPPGCPAGQKLQLISQVPVLFDGGAMNDDSVDLFLASSAKKSCFFHVFFMLYWVKSCTHLHKCNST